MPLDHEFPDLVPLFVGEARERLERLTLLSGQLEGDDAGSHAALVEARRELHTLKGAGRMMRLNGFAELCHGAETLLKGPRRDVPAWLVRAVDRLSAMVDRLAAGEDPGADPALVAALEGRDAGVEQESVGDLPPVAAAPAESGAPTPSAAAEPVAVELPFVPLVAPPLPSPSSATPVVPPPGPPPVSVAGDLRLDAATVDALAERATRLRILVHGAEQFSHRLYDLAHFAEQGVREPAPTQVLALLASTLRRVAIELEGGQRRLRRITERQFDDILALQLQPLRPFLLSLSRHARELARSLDREVEIELHGEDTRLDRRIIRELEEAMLHLVHNAVDHGIEPRAERLARGKPAGGRLTLAAETDGARVRLSVSDDGAGVDSAAVRDAARRAGLLDGAAPDALDRDEVLRLLFRPGFSTRTEVTEVSGRGVGLDAVWSVVSRVGGEVRLESEPGRGTRVTLEVPLARRGETVLLVRVGRLHLALPRGVVDGVTRLGADRVVARGGRRVARVGEPGSERLVEFVPLAEIVGEEPAADALLLEGAVAGLRLAVAVDAVEGEEEVLVRPLGRLLAGSPLLEGVALAAGGMPVGVLSPARLVRSALSETPRPPRERVLAKRLRVLLVDDSLVTREMERRLLGDAGFEVTAAADAEEALTYLGERGFDCVVTDIEMPGMDGFELTRHLRAMPHLAQLPVVVVSTRDRPEDRLRGLEAGADAYLTKQGLDAGELVGVVRRLGAA